ncbi:MAG: ATP synthase F1 subunit epsilon [Solirubrobacteraceae bacterium]
MAHAKFQVEILTPDGLLLDEEVEMVSTRTTIGVIGILANHEPLLGMLEPTELRVYRSDDEVLRFAQSEGYLQVGGNRAMLLLEDAARPEQLDVGVLNERLAEARRELDESEHDSERHRQASREQKRWQAYLKVAQS